MKPRQGFLSRRRIIIGIATAIPILLIALAAIKSLNSHRSALKELRAAGIAVTQEESRATYPPIDPEINAAPLLIEAYELIQESKEIRKQLPLELSEKPFDHDASLDADTLLAIAGYVAKNASVYEKLEEALRRPDCRFETDIADAKSIGVIHLMAIKKLNRSFLLHRALLHASAGRTTEATDDILNSLTLTTFLAREPLAISQLVRIAAEGDTWRALEHILNFYELPPDQLLRIQDAVSRTVGIDRAADILGPELVVCLQVLTGSADEVGPWIDVTFGEDLTPVQRLRHFAWVVGGIRSAERSYLSETMLELSEAAKIPRPERVAAISAIEAATKLKSASWVQSRFFFLSSDFIDTIVNSLVKIEAGHARALVVQVMCAVERYRYDHAGSRPPNLESLVPDYLDAVPDDPMDGKPIRYILLESPARYVVYSVGTDGIDDGGLQRTEPIEQRKTSLDISYVVTTDR
jgi:hypothetical protein